MENYQNILLAIDFFEHNHWLIEKAKNITATYQSTLSIVHVVDNLQFSEPPYDSFHTFSFDITKELIGIAKQKLTQMANELGVAEQNTYLEIGSPKTGIIRVADKIQADLIIVGSHGRHGLALLLGSTANSVLHHAKCDVLAVRLQD